MWHQENRCDEFATIEEGLSFKAERVELPKYMVPEEIRAYNGNDATMQPYFGTSGLTVNGKTYTSPKVEAHTFFLMSANQFRKQRAK